MITSVPWPELASSARRIVRRGCDGQWISSSAGDRIVPVRCYATSNFNFAIIVAHQSDLPKLLGCSGHLKISPKGDETVLLKFCPTVATLVSDNPGGSLFLPHLGEAERACRCASSELALIFGRIDSVELIVPSHAIDVIAPLWQPAKADPAMFAFGLN